MQNVEGGHHAPPPPVFLGLKCIGYEIKALNAV